MPYQPMASRSGVAPGIFGQRNPKKALDAAVHDHQAAIVEAGSLLEDLVNSPGVLAVAHELEGRINHFLRTDEQSVALLRIISKWRNILEFAPRAAEEKVRRLMGPQLSAVRDETQAAP